MPVPAGVIEARLDFLDGHVALLDSSGHAERWYLAGMSAARLAERLLTCVRRWGGIPELEPAQFGAAPLTEWSLRDAHEIFRVLSWSDSLLKAFRARQRRETSPVALWPHHFDVSLLWLTGRQVPDHDPVDEEAADEQMNFGFSLGAPDERPYLYVTCYPEAEGWPGIELPVYAAWHDGQWRGVRIDYDALRVRSVSDGRLLELMELLRSRGEAALGP